MASSHNVENFQTLKLRLRQSFLTQLPDRFQHIQNHLAQLALEVPDAAVVKEHVQALHLHFHTIKGSSASFGFSRIAKIAQLAEQVVRELLDGHKSFTLELQEELYTRLQDIKLLHEFYLTADPQIEQPSPVISAIELTSEEAETRSGQLIYLCDDDAMLAQQLANQLRCFGYHIIPFTDLDQLRQMFLKQLPAAVIMDIMFPEGENAGPELLAKLNQRLACPIPSIFISSRDDFAARLRSVQAGGNAYCAKPVKTPEIVEFLDLITNRTAPEPFNILVIDDDLDVAHYHAMALCEAGMVTKVVENPEQILTILETFRADLVLMDLYMPSCSGPELASLLRQIPGFVSLPIIYVSAETNTNRQFKALSVGADGFLTKPIAPERLVAEVQLRAERMRTLRSLMIRDSLTGLFNHNTILQFLEVAVATSRRKNSSLCFAMIDVDYFKQVNDCYGHAAGDQVLMALSRTLRLRLRDSDLVGRYGGEEFAVVLTDNDLTTACQIFDELRESFANVSFTVNNRVFCCTFSIGIASFPDCSDVRTLIEVADRALYRAKKNGRNRIESLRSMDLT
jgi:diguanylate cyclase (GGDEF)-like protein